VNGDPPHWLKDVGESLPRMYVLELVEAALQSHPEVFLKRPEFSHLLKERVCPFVIKFFSPGAKKDALMVCVLHGRKTMATSYPQGAHSARVRNVGGGCAGRETSSNQEYCFLSAG
jgi:hypothetical protein